jgi:hypothetical protein
MYRMSTTEIPGMSMRPFSQRLGSYERSTFTLPTVTGTPRQPFSVAYGNQPVSGGLGLDLSGLTSSPLFWLAAAAAGYYFYFRPRR